MRSKRMYLFFCRMLTKKAGGKTCNGKGSFQKDIKKVKRDSRLISPQKYNYIMKR